MEIHCTHIPYEQTGFFSKIVIDYLNQSPQLQPFYQHPVSLEGIKESIKARQAFNTNRSLLVTELEKQYAGLPLSVKQQENLQSLLSSDTFTITTAHQPNIFTGPLYFIYKIMHAIKMADGLRAQLSGFHFVPVYYMGSEDADLEELGRINLNGKDLVWKTTQTGAVGRMKVDKPLLELIDAIYGQIGVQPFGPELVTFFKKAYTIGKSIQQATLELVNELFADFGLLVVIPDNAELKRSFNPIVQKELEQQFSHKAVASTITELEKNYKVQAGGRDLNLFYLSEDKRERIEFKGVNYYVPSLNLAWNKQEILQELQDFPAHFSANVILRGLFQETILPNIAFIGGGGELAYWLELKNLFKIAQVPYPLLVLRNSLLLMDNNSKQLITNLELSNSDLFKTTFQLTNDMVLASSVNQLSLIKEKEELTVLYKRISALVGKVDSTLKDHSKALEIQALKKLDALEKKMLRAEKRKFTEQQFQITRIKDQLFPAKSLQERINNFSSYYAAEGKAWLHGIYQASAVFNASFTIVD